MQFISIHTFLAEGDNESQYRASISLISIHTFLAEGDALKGVIFRDPQISIHTFLAEGDLQLFPLGFSFYPFQSTPSLRKVTYEQKPMLVTDAISIHTFLAEGDISCRRKGMHCSYFNPHLPCGR